MHLSPPVALAAVRSKAVVLLLLIRCWLLLPLWDSIILLCCVVRYFFAIIVIGKRELVAWLCCLPGVSWLLCDSSSRCHGLVCSLWLWYFLIKFTYYFCMGFWYSLIRVQRFKLLSQQADWSITKSSKRSRRTSTRVATHKQDGLTSLLHDYTFVHKAGIVTEF